MVKSFMPRGNVLDDERIGKLLLKLATPAFFGMFVMTLYNVVNTIFISRYVGPLGIAGLSICFPLQMFSNGIGQMTGMGGASHISRLIGVQNIPRAEKVLGNAISITIALSILISAIGLAGIDFWLRLMGASDTILPYARDYFTIILIGNVFQVFAMSIASLLISEGNARISMTGMIIGAVLNIILCAVFIILLGWGIKGSALATVLAQVISVIYFLFYYLGGKTFLKIHLKNLAVEWNIVKGILSIGVASFVRTLAGSLSAIVVNRVLISYGGDMEISAFGLINRIMMFAIMPGMVIGQGLQPILGFNYGARHFDRALKAIKIAAISATVLSFAVFVVLYFFPRPIVCIFTSNTELIDLTTDAAKKIFLAIFVVGFMNVGSTVFQALGKSIPAFITSLARPVFFLIPLIFILSNVWQLTGVWLAFPITDIMTCALTALLLVPVIKNLQKMNRMNAVKEASPLPVEGK
jgi:putative MATE family efflux protein